VPKTRATWADVLRNAVGWVSVRIGWAGLGRKWDDLRPAGLKLIFLVVSRVMLLLGLSRREAWWKDAEILMLRHQLAVAQRERPWVWGSITRFRFGGLPGGDHRWVIFSVVYLFVCSLLRCLMVRGRPEVSKDAELLVLACRPGSSRTSPVSRPAGR
jgi:hypothetical protein